MYLYAKAAADNKLRRNFAEKIQKKIFKEKHILCETSKFQDNPPKQFVGFLQVEKLYFSWGKQLLITWNYVRDTKVIYRE